MQNSQPEEPTGGNSNEPGGLIKRVGSKVNGTVVAIIIVVAVIAIYVAQH